MTYAVQQFLSLHVGPSNLMKLVQVPISTLQKSYMRIWAADGMPGEYKKLSTAMRETTFAFAPLIIAIYFLFFPSQFAVAIFWILNFLRL